MEEVACPACHQVLAQGETACPSCGQAVVAAFTTYPRLVQPRTGIAAYGSLYVAAAVAWGLLPLAFGGIAAWSLLISWWPVVLNFWSSLVIVLLALQLVEGIGLLLGKKWARVLASIHSFGIALFFVVLMLSILQSLMRPGMDSLTVFGISLLLAEGLVSIGLAYQIGRSWVIDSRISKAASLTEGPMEL